MSQRTREFFAALKEGAGAVWDQAERAGMQGAAELSAALFQGHGYVPYGVGQQSADKEAAQETFAEKLKGCQPEPQQEQSQGMEM